MENLKAALKLRKIKVSDAALEKVINDLGLDKGALSDSDVETIIEMMGGASLATFNQQVAPLEPIKGKIDVLVSEVQGRTDAQAEAIAQHLKDIVDSTPNRALRLFAQKLAEGDDDPSTFREEVTTTLDNIFQVGV